MNERTTPEQIGVPPDRALKQAIAAHAQGDLLGSEKIFREILKQYPDNFQALASLGTVLLTAGRADEAVQFLQQALDRQPNSALTHTVLARALQLLGRDEEALKRARRATALNPELPDAHATIAGGLAYLGRYDEAIRAMARAIELAPGRAQYYYLWGQITRWAADDPRLAALEALAQNSGSRPLDEQAELNFALAKAYADCGDIERSFRRQIEGGAQQRRINRYDEATTLRDLDEPCRTLDAAWMGRHAGVGDPSPLSVFVVGMPRSGTTLVEQILASHPKVRALGERRTFNEALARMWGMTAVAPSVASQLPDGELRRLGALYLAAVRRNAPADAERLIDKLPANFQFVGLIHAALPNARIIHTRRDPVDTCLSLFSLRFAGSAQLYSYDLRELGRYYRAYEKLMAHWRNILPAGVMLEVQYEEVVNDLERQARRIVAHCGLEWDDACLRFHQTQRSIRTASHTQVRQPIYRSSVGRPRPPRDLLLPLLETLGVG